jgi:uncharacterized membrane protein
MRSSHIPVVVFSLLSLTIIGLTAYYLPMLPDQVATHFGPGGRANGWHNHTDFIEIVAICVAIPAAIFLSGDLLTRLPDTTINLPNKRYWLAPGRRDDTLTFIRDWIRWIAVLVLGLLTLVIGMGLRANLTAPPHFPDYAPWILATFALFVVAMIIVLVRRFGASAN